MGRYGRAQEVSSVISLLTSEGGGYMTGQNLLIDGGLTRTV
jgi:NAD(P)-dependent dehydrogenase (short-subunit alcohol dehydrogenase family)